jgi:hypothetical protein
MQIYDFQRPNRSDDLNESDLFMDGNVELRLRGVMGLCHSGPNKEGAIIEHLDEKSKVSSPN